MVMESVTLEEIEREKEIEAIFEDVFGDLNDPKGTCLLIVVDFVDQKVICEKLI